MTYMAGQSQHRRPSSSVCLLKTMPADFRANSLASFALRVLRGTGRRSSFQEIKRVQDLLCCLAAAVQRIEYGDTIDPNHYRLAVQGVGPRLAATAPIAG
jgi:hypothetical protein